MKRLSLKVLGIAKSITGFMAGRVVPTVIALLAVSIGGTLFAALNPPSAPDQSSSQSYTLADICNRLETGAEGSLTTTFTEPTAGVSDTMCTLTDIGNMAPTVDSDECATISSVQSGKTFWGRCAGAGWGLLTGTGSIDSSPPGSVAATLQTICYNASGGTITCAGTGQDGEYQMGETASPRFTDNADGTVTDNLTGLVWLRNANCSATLGGVNKTNTLTWENSLTWSNNLASGSCGLTDGSVAGDWRLPNVREMISLVDYGIGTAPRLPTGHPFTSVQSNWYWASTSYSMGLANSWRVDLNDGNPGFSIKTNFSYVLPVR